MCRLLTAGHHRFIAQTPCEAFCGSGMCSEESRCGQGSGCAAGLSRGAHGTARCCTPLQGRSIQRRRSAHERPAFAPHGQCSSGCPSIVFPSHLQPNAPRPRNLHASTTPPCLNASLARRRARRPGTYFSPQGCPNWSPIASARPSLLLPLPLLDPLCLHTPQHPHRNQRIAHLPAHSRDIMILRSS